MNAYANSSDVQPYTEYINPFELLNSSSEFLDEGNTREIKRAKTRLLHELKLNKGKIEWIPDAEFDEGQVRQVLDDLDDPVRRSYHSIIHRHGPLLRFLTHGNLGFFFSLSSKIVAELPTCDPRFLDFISRSFCRQYNRALFRAVKASDLRTVTALTAVNMPLLRGRVDDCYGSAHQLLAELAAELRTQRTSMEYSIEEALSLRDSVKRRVQPALLNALPEYFHDSRNEIARALRGLAIAAYNKQDDNLLASDLLGIARSLSVDSTFAEQLDEDEKALRIILERQQQEIADQALRQQSVLKDEIREVCVNGGSAVVPQACACCMRPPTSSQSVSYSWEESNGLSQIRRTRSFGFPICNSCLQHQQEYHRQKRWVAVLAGAASILVFWLVAANINQPNFLGFVMAGTLVTTTFLFCASTFIQVAQLGNHHACRDEPVVMCSASEQTITFRFQNPLYADAFAQANGTDAVTRTFRKLPRGPNLLRGRGMLFPLAAALVLGCVGHGIIYVVMRDSRWHPQGSASSVIASRPRRSASPAQNAAPSVSNSERFRLSSQIDAGKARAAEMEAELKRIDAQVDSWSGQIDRSARAIAQYEQQLKRGTLINEALYQQTIDFHNSIVGQYNSMLVERRDKHAAYSQQIDTVNEMVRRYNQGGR